MISSQVFEIMGLLGCLYIFGSIVLFRLKKKKNCRVTSWPSEKELSLLDPQTQRTRQK